MDYCIKNGTLVDPAAGHVGRFDLLIREGKVVEVAPELVAPDDVTVIDAAGLHILPGLVDMHAHFREPGREDKETIATGSRAAAAGGFTAVAVMPNTQPPIDSPYHISYVKEQGEVAGLCRVLPIGCTTKGQQGEEIAELGEMAAAGAVAFSNDGVPLMNAEVMRCVMEYSRLFDKPILIHAEDRYLAGEGQMHLGHWSTVLGLKGIPTLAEEVIVARDLLLAEATGARIHFCHLSSAKSVELVRAAKARGVRVTAEVTPHHLVLTDAAVDEFDTNTKVNPPLVSEYHRQALLAGLLDGTIDAIATDHAPHTREEKHREYDLAPFGQIGLETALALVLAELYHQKRAPLARIVEWMSVNPARILGQSGGDLAVGSPADLALVDLERKWQLTMADIYSKSKNTPFLGREFTGRVVMTLFGGQITHKLPDFSRPEDQRVKGA